MEDSPKAATREELEAKLQVLENDIALKNIEMKKKVKASQASFDKQHEIVVMLGRKDLSPEDRQKLHAAFAELDKDPIYVEWKVLSRGLTGLISQSIMIKHDLRKMRTEARLTGHLLKISVPTEAQSRSPERSAQPSAQAGEASSSAKASLKSPARTVAQGGLMKRAESGTTLVKPSVVNTVEASESRSAESSAQPSEGSVAATAEALGTPVSTAAKSGKRADSGTRLIKTVWDGVKAFFKGLNNNTEKEEAIKEEKTI